MATLIKKIFFKRGSRERQALLTSLYGATNVTICSYIEYARPIRKKQKRTNAKAKRNFGKPIYKPTI